MSNFLWGGLFALVGENRCLSLRNTEMIKQKPYLLHQNRMRLFACLLGLFLTCLLPAQQADLPLRHDLYHYLDRLDIQDRLDTVLYSTIKPYSREMVAAMLRRAEVADLGPGRRAWHHRMRMLGDDQYAVAQSRTGWLSEYLYRNGRDFGHVVRGETQLFINPVAHVIGGLSRNNDPTAPEPQLFVYRNTRGSEGRGSLFGKVGVYTMLADNVTRVPWFLYRRYLSSEQLYGEGRVKRFGEVNGLDYFVARGYLTYSPFRGMRIKFGRDRAFWGSGYQSLLLSDHAPDLLMLNITTRIWKFEYVNHFTQMIDFVPLRNDDEGDYPRKYGAFHALNFVPNRYFSVGVFESVVYSSYLVNRFRGFELQYLNPLIFYRAAEQYIGSPDNGLLGVQVKGNVLRRFQLYGQILLDDFNFGVRDQGLDYWGNKLGWQAGLKYIDMFGIPTLDGQVELNHVRPYVYQHFNRASAYTHFGQSLGHGAGANLDDYTVILRYQPLPAWHLQLAFTQIDQGLNQDDLNYGANPEDISSGFTGNRPGDFGVVVGQGAPYRMRQLHGRLSWQIGHTDMYLEAEGRYRTENELRTASAMLGFRFNFVGKVAKF